MGLASVLADELDGEVTLVDADFSTHSVGMEYGLYGEEGLAEVLNGSATIEAVAHPVPQTRLKIVTAGSQLRDIDRRVRTERARELIRDIKQMSGHVVLDLPAVLISSTAPVIASMCDGVIIVIRSGHTTTQEVESTLDKLGEANVLGVVLNRWSTSIPSWVEKTLGLKR